MEKQFIVIYMNDGGDLYGSKIFNKKIDAINFIDNDIDEQKSILVQGIELETEDFT